MMCYGSAVQACANEGLSEEALDVMRRMNAAGFVPDKTAYNAAITACGEQGEWEKALEILAEMRGAGLRPDQHSYRFAMQVRVGHARAGETFECFARGVLHLCCVFILSGNERVIMV